MKDENRRTRTGNFRFRQGWFGAMILEVEVQWFYWNGGSREEGSSTRASAWMRADATDAQNVALLLSGTTNHGTK